MSGIGARLMLIFFPQFFLPAYDYKAVNDSFILFYKEVDVF